MPSPVEVQFIFGIRSRHSYLAATEVERLERETGARVASASRIGLALDGPGWGLAGSKGARRWPAESVRRQAAPAAAWRAPMLAADRGGLGRA